MGQPHDAHDALQPHAVEPEPVDEPDDPDAGEDDRRHARNPGGDATDADPRQGSG
jgi:hypothetical protein